LIAAKLQKPIRRHSGEGRNPEHFSNLFELPWTPAFAGVTQRDFRFYRDIPYVSAYGLSPE
jgi:hypothetical protein